MRKFIIGIIIFLIIVFVLQLNMPRQHRWEPTFSHTDPEPFGSMVFDSVLCQSLKKGYSVTNKSIYQILKDSAFNSRPHGLMIVCEEFDLDSLTYSSLLKLAERGHHVLIAADPTGKYSEKLTDTLHVSLYSYTYFDVLRIRKSLFMTEQSLYDTLKWIGHPSLYPTREYSFLSQMIDGNIHTRIKTSLDTLSVMYKRRMPIWEDEEISEEKADVLIDTVITAATLPFGKGKFIFAPTPLLFTNYGILDDSRAEYVFRILSEMGDVPVVRTENYIVTSATLNNRMSPFRYFLSQRPLKWALYLSLVMMLLFFLFTARRRQSVIPVIETPKNPQLEFVKLIGTLYHQKHDNTDLLQKKFLFFSEELRRQTGIDIQDDTDDEHTFLELAKITGMPATEIRDIILTLRVRLSGNEKTDDKTLQQLIDKMDSINKAL